MSEPDGSGPIPRRTPRTSDGGAPISGALAIVLAVVAVVAGFLILRSISDGGENSLGVSDGAANGAAGSEDAEATSDSVDGSDDATPATLAPTTTAPVLVTEGASVIVANANGQGGSAGGMTRALETGPGYDMVDPTNASSAIGTIAESIIYFTSGNTDAQAVAESLGRSLGGVGTIAPMPDPPPTSDAQLNGADVLLMLGEDKANKTLAELNPGGESTAGVESPDVVGEATTTSTTVAG